MITIDEAIQILDNCIPDDYGKLGQVKSLLKSLQQPKPVAGSFEWADAYMYANPGMETEQGGCRYRRYDSELQFFHRFDGYWCAIGDRMPLGVEANGWRIIEPKPEVSKYVECPSKEATHAECNGESLTRREGISTLWRCGEYGSLTTNDLIALKAKFLKLQPPEPLEFDALSVEGSLRPQLVPADGRPLVPNMRFRCVEILEKNLGGSK